MFASIYIRTDVNICAEPGSGVSCHPCLYSVMLHFISVHTCDKSVENVCIKKKQNGTRLSLMCNEVTTRRQTCQRLSWKQSDESKVQYMGEKKKKKCWTNGKSWATVLFLHCDEYEGRNVWCWGGEKGGGGVQAAQSRWKSVNASFRKRAKEHSKISSKERRDHYQLQCAC